MRDHLAGLIGVGRPSRTGIGFCVLLALSLLGVALAFHGWALAIWGWLAG